jgi:hypothetical protein
LKGSDLLVTTTAAATLLVVVVLTIYPRPPRPYDYLPYIFVACVVCGALISVLRSVSFADRATELNRS